MDGTHRIVVAGGRVLTPWRVLDPGTVVVEGERVAAVLEGPAPDAQETERVDATGLWVVPGFVDVHIHGAAGHDTMDATREALAGMARFLARHGVTASLPTTVAAATEDILAAVENVAACQGRDLGGARVLGVHLEGPYLSRERPGAQPVEHIRPPHRAEYERFFAWGNVRCITLAPEVPGARDLVTYAAERGAAVAVGHSTATYEEVLEAVALGLNQASHTFNAMPPLHHRRPGVVGAALTCDNIFAQVIVDLVHIHPAVVRLLVRAKGARRTILVSDAMRAAGLPDGAYDLAGQTVRVQDGVARLAPGGSLAGSTLTLDRALANVMAAAGLSLEEALPMATAVPAAAIGLGDTLGALEPGCQADLVLLDASLRVRLTMVGGKVVYRSEPAPPSNRG
ncbi:MAG: N-acetylglucosamine-6-phosphate deacetylase [Anaerolineae bacterium]|nr:N-acetylglucosamine-6-phosphate deacetylase [Anaerolineae bacterium]